MMKTLKDQRKIFFQKILSLTKHDMEMRAIPSSRRIFTRDLNNIEKFIEENKNDNLYFGVYTREGGGRKEHVKEIYCYFADIDFKNYPGGKAEARERLNAFINSTGLKPTFIIHSGNGLHVYWFLNYVIEQSLKVEAILRGIAKHLGADISVCELARILRIPGTYNRKKNDKKTVTILEHNDVSYNPEIFNQFEDKDDLKNNDSLKDLYRGVPDGQRNVSLTRLIGSLVNDGLSYDECLEFAYQWNERNNPPETDFKEIERTVRSIFEKHHRGHNKEVEDIKALSEAIAEATTKNYHELLPELANLDSEIEKEILCKVLSKRIGVNYRTVRNEIKVYEQKKESIVTDTNIIIAHPSYHIDKGFLNLGFREVKVIGNNPEEQNFYVISDKDGIYINENRILQYGGKTIIFDERDRLLIKHEDRWNKNKILSFIKNPESPVGLYYEIKNILKQYIELPKDAAYGLLSSWIIASYFFLIFYAFPFLFIFGKKQSGKSRLLTLLERLCLNALKVKGVSVPSMVDSIDGVRGTFLNDQAESLSDNKNIELLGIITDSYTRGGGNRRIVDISNKKRRVLEFEAYSPKAFASTKEIDEDLKDRCIEITMLRAMKDYPEPEAFLLIWQDLRDKLYRLLLSKWHFAQEIYQGTGKGVTQRVRELWRPLETILTLERVSIEEVQKIRAFFLESMLVTQSELSDNEIELFETLLMLLEDKGECVLTVSEIAREIKHDEGISEKGLQTWVGRTLRQFGLYDYQAGRKGKARAYKFNYDHIKDVLNRYTLTGSGFSGNVDETLDNQQSINDHFKNIGGIGGSTSGLDTTDQPPKTTEKNQVVNSKPLTDNGLDHLTTKTTSPIGEEVIEVFGVTT